MIRLAVAVALVGTMVSCAEGVRPPDEAAGQPSVSAQPSPSPTEQEAARPLPGPNKRVPRGAKTIARHLTAETDALRGDLRAWLADGSPKAREDLRPLVLRGLYQQRLFRHLTKDEAKARK